MANNQLITLCFFLTSFALSSQTTISGSVIDGFGSPVTGANIFVQGTYDGTSSDTIGRFTFTTVAMDSVTIVCSYIGYQDFSQDALLTEDTVVLEIHLDMAFDHLNEVVITAGSFEAGGSGKSELLKPLDIVTTAGATADIAGALNTLPGTQTVGEEGKLFVRGGDSYETITYIDGLAVQESYSRTPANIPSRGRFSPFMFSGTRFSTGGYSAEFGQGLSSALILDTKEVASQTRTDLSFITVGLEAARTQVWDNASLAGKITYYNLDPYYQIIKQDFDWLDAPTTIDGNIAYRQNIGKQGMLKSYGKYSYSAMTFNQGAPDEPASLIKTDVKNNYGYLNISYKDILSEKWSIRGGLSFSSVKDDVGLNDDDVQQGQQGWHGKIVFGYEHNRNLFLRIGTDVITRAIDFEYIGADGIQLQQINVNEELIAPFVEGDWYITSKLVARLGARIEHNTLQDNTSVDPRMSLAFKLNDDSQVSAAFGLFRQSAPTYLLQISPSLASEKAAHYILNYQWTRSLRTFRLEAFVKQYSNLVTFDPAMPFNPQSYANQGDGFANGIDFFYRDAMSIRNADFWVSYGFLDTERHYHGYPTSAAPTFSSKHNFSAVYKHFITRFKSQVGVTYSVASGRPYHDPNTTAFNSGRTPVYQDLSVNISYLPTPSIIVYVSVTNVLNRQNIFGYTYDSQPNSDGIYEREPVTLPARRFVLLGVFVTISKSKTLNQLPNL